MKIVRLNGGLGNAMFQYCIFLQLKKMYKNDDIYVDSSFYKLTGYPFELHKVIGHSVRDFDISEKFVKDQTYLAKLDKLRYWHKLGFQDFKDMVRGSKEKIYTKLEGSLSYIELPLLYKDKIQTLEIISPYGDSIEVALRKFSNEKDNKDISFYKKIRHSIDKLLNHLLKGEVKVKYNVLKSPDVRKRLIKQIIKGEKPDWCYYGDLKLLSSCGDTYYNLYGNPCNLEGIEEDVKKEFCFSPFEDDNNITMAEKIISEESVAVHARVVNFDYGMKDSLARNYYKKSVMHLKNKIDKPLSFFVFSDNPDWCKNNLDKLGLYGEKVTFVNFNSGEEAFRDMQLMSLCKHIITAKSTFSWWAGTLIKNPYKIFVTPYGFLPGSISF